MVTAGIIIVILLLVGVGAMQFAGVKRMRELRGENQELREKLSAAQADVTRVNGHNEILRGYLKDARKDLKDAMTRIMTMKKEGFNSGVPATDDEDDVKIPAEIERFIGRIRAPHAADQVREDVEAALARGEDTETILNRLRKGEAV